MPLQYDMQQSDKYTFQALLTVVPWSGFPFVKLIWFCCRSVCSVVEYNSLSPYKQNRSPQWLPKFDIADRAIEMSSPVAASCCGAASSHYLGWVSLLLRLWVAAGHDGEQENVCMRIHRNGTLVLFFITAPSSPYRLPEVFCSLTWIRSWWSPHSCSLRSR